MFIVNGLFVFYRTWQLKPGPEDENLGGSVNYLKKNADESVGPDVKRNYFNLNETVSSNGNDYEASSESVTIPGTFRYYFVFLQNLVNQMYSNMNKFEHYTSDSVILNLDVKKTVLQVTVEERAD